MAVPVREIDLTGWDSSCLCPSDGCGCAVAGSLPSPKFPQFFSFCAVQRIDLQGQMSLEQQENVPM